MRKENESAAVFVLKDFFFLKTLHHGPQEEAIVQRKTPCDIMRCTRVIVFLLSVFHNVVKAVIFGTK